MGVTFSLILGEPDTIERSDPFRMPATDAIITKILDQVALYALHAIVMQHPFTLEGCVTFMNPPVVDWMDSDGFDICQLPTAFVIRLAQLPDDEVARAAIAWKNTDEMSDPELTPDWVRDLVGDIRTLCRRAVQQNQQVFLFCML
jgi:hypothetical protein